MLNKEHFKAYAALICVCIFWGTTYLGIRIAVQTIPPFWLVGIRQTIAGLIICSFFLLKGHSLPTVQQLKQLLLAGFLMIVVANGLVSWAEVYVPSGLTALLCALMPFWIIGFNVLTQHTEGINAKTIVGLLVGLSGLIFIFFDNLKDLTNPHYLIGIVAILTANAGWAMGTLYMKRKKQDLPPLYMAGLQILLGGLMVDVIALLIDKPFPTTFDPSGVWALIYLILFGSILSYGAYVYALSKLPSTLVSLYAYVNPAVAVLLGWLILDEKLNSITFLAMSFILLGVFIVNESFKIKISTPKPEPTIKPKLYGNG